MQISIPAILSVSLLCGLAGFIDSIAGGGGLISLPANLMTGLLSQFAAGSNKFSAAIGTSAAIIRFSLVNNPKSSTLV